MPARPKKRPCRKGEGSEPKRTQHGLPPALEGIPEGSAEYVAYVLCHGDRANDPQYQEAARLVILKGISALHIRQYYSEGFGYWLLEGLDPSVRAAIDTVFQLFLHSPRSSSSAPPPDTPADTPRGAVPSSGLPPRTIRQLKFCCDCGKQVITPETKFCTECGAEVIRPPARS